MAEKLQLLRPTVCVPHFLGHCGRSWSSLQVRAWSTGLGHHGYAPNHGHGYALCDRLCRPRPRFLQCVPRPWGWGRLKHPQGRRQPARLDQLLRCEAMDPGPAGSMGGAVTTSPACVGDRTQRRAQYLPLFSEVGLERHMHFLLCGTPWAGLPWHC